CLCVFVATPPTPRSTLCPYTTLFRSIVYQEQVMQIAQAVAGYSLGQADLLRKAMGKKDAEIMAAERDKFVSASFLPMALRSRSADRKSTRLNSSHLVISYAVFCLKKK